MNKIFMMCVGLAAASGVSGCMSVCARENATAKSYQDKVKDCYPNGGAPVILSTRVDTCEQKLNQCSKDDLTKVDAFIDCVNATPKCDPGSKNEFTGKILDCQHKLDGMQLSCLAAFSP